MAGTGRFVVRIRIRGELGPAFVALFDDLAVCDGGDGTTILQGEAVDQSAVHGLLDRVRDLGLPLVSVETSLVPSQASRIGDE